MKTVKQRRIECPKCGRSSYCNPGEKESDFEIVYVAYIVRPAYLLDNHLVTDSDAEEVQDTNPPQLSCLNCGTKFKMPRWMHNLDVVSDHAEMTDFPHALSKRISKELAERARFNKQRKRRGKNKKR